MYLLKRDVIAGSKEGEEFVRVELGIELHLHLMVLPASLRVSLKQPIKVLEEQSISG